MKLPHILFLAGSGVGGTEKCATIFAVSLSQLGYHVSFAAEPGPRTASFANEGITLVSPQNIKRSMGDILGNLKPDVIYQHVPGYPSDNPVYATLASLGVHKPKLIETNVFGQFRDPLGLKMVDYRMFVSSASATQAFLRVGRYLNRDTLGSNTVLYNPVPIPAKQMSHEERAAFRQNIGIANNDILFLRIGRPGHKWCLWEFEAFKTIHANIPAARLVLMEPPGIIQQAILKSNISSHVKCLKLSDNFQWIENLNQAADVSIHASAWGESFGYTIAEAMAAGVPVITKSTPWGDNAQVELVENGETGFVCLSTQEMARRGVDLAKNPELRQKMGEKGLEQIRQLCDPATETSVLEDVISLVLGGVKSSRLLQREKHLCAFASSFNAREYCFSEPPRSRPMEATKAYAFLVYKLIRAAIGRRIT